MPPNNVAMLPVADLRKSLPNGKISRSWLPTLLPCPAGRT